MKTIALSALLAASTLVVPLSAQAAVLGVFTQDYGIGLDQPVRLGNANTVESDHLHIRELGFPNFLDTIDFSSVVGTISEIQFTLFSEGAFTPCFGLFCSQFLDGESWRVRIFGSDNFSSTDDFIGSVDGSGAPKTHQFLVNASPSSTSFFLDLVAMKQITFEFFEPQLREGVFDLYKVEVRVLGDVASVPLPAAAPLLAGAVGGLGLLGLRRKHKASA